MTVVTNLSVGTNQLATGIASYFNTLVNGRPVINWANGDWWAEGIGQTAALGWPPLTATAIASGVSAADSFQGDHFGRYTMGAAALTANSGFNYMTKSDGYAPRDGLLSWTIFRVDSTNDVIFSGGFIDSTTASASTDAMQWRIENGYFFGRNISNTVASDTVTSNQISAAATWYSAIAYVQATNQVVYALLSEVGDVLWQDTNTTMIPQSRGHGAGLTVFRVNTNAPNTLGYLDAMGVVTVGRKLER